MNSRTPHRSRTSLQKIYSNSALCKSIFGYLLGGLTVAFAFSGICLMSCDAKIRKQEIKITQFQSENFAADLNNLNALHGKVTAALDDNKITCPTAVRHLKDIHIQQLELERLATPGFFLAGLRWSRLRYFDGMVAEPIMTLFLLFSIVGLVWLIITVFRNSDNIRRTTISKFHSIPSIQRFLPPDPGGNKHTSSAQQYPPIEMDSMNNVNYKESMTSSRNGDGGKPYHYRSVPSMPAGQASDTGYGCRFNPDAGDGGGEGDLPHRHHAEHPMHEEPSNISQGTQGVPSYTQYPSHTSTATDHTIQRSEERIPKCYKLKELESDLESITRLELDDPTDPDLGNDYVYGPWRVYCESRDGNLQKPK